MPPKKRARIRGPARGPSSRGPSRASSASMVTSEPITFKDREQQLRYNALAKRPLGVCRYVDEQALTALGLFDEAMSLVHNVGWERFVQIKPHTYRELTLEFLSSLSLELSVSHEEANGHIDFRLMGQDFSLTLEQLNNMFGFDDNGLRKAPPTFLDSPAWRQLSREYEYSSSMSKSSQLRKHAHRYLHRVMAHTLLGRGESTGVVNKNELLFLWCMEKGFKINTGIWLCKHLLHVSKAEKGKIMVGGLITQIAEALEVFDPDTTTFSIVEGNERVDLELLMSMRVCTRFNGELFLLSGEGQRVPIGTHNEEPPAEVVGHDEGAMQVAQTSVHHERLGSPDTLAQIIQRLDRIESNIGGCNERLDRIEAKLEAALDALGVQRGHPSSPPSPPPSI